jgi:hypothetical protein
MEITSKDREESDNVLVITDNLVGIVSEVHDIVLPDGEVSCVRRINKAFVKQFSHGNKLEKKHIHLYKDSVTEVIGGQEKGFSYPKIRNIGVLIERNELSLESALGLYAYIHMDGKHVEKHTNCFGLIVDTSELMIESYATVLLDIAGEEQTIRVPCNNIYPLIDSTPFFVTSPIDVFAKVMAYSSPTRSRILFIHENEDLCRFKGFVEASFYPRGAKNFDTDKVKVETTNLIIPDFFLDIRDNKKLKVENFRNLSNGKSFYELSKKLRKLECSALNEGMVLAYALGSAKAVCTLEELPCERNGYYAGVSFLTPRFQDYIILDCGKQGIYVNPRKLQILDNRASIYENQMISIKKFHYKNKDLSGMEARVLFSYRGKKHNLFDPGLHPGNLISNSYGVIEFKQDIGGHSADGQGSPGKCLTIPVDFIRQSLKDLGECKSFICQQRYLYIDKIDIDEYERRFVEEVQIEDKKDKSVNLDIENLVGILLGNDNTSIAGIKSSSNTDQWMRVNHYVIPASYIKTISMTYSVKRIEEQEQRQKRKDKYSSTKKATKLSDLYPSDFPSVAGEEEEEEEENDCYTVNHHKLTFKANPYVEQPWPVKDLGLKSKTKTFEDNKHLTEPIEVPQGAPDFEILNSKKGPNYYASKIPDATDYINWSAVDKGPKAEWEHIPALSLEGVADSVQEQKLECGETKPHKHIKIPASQDVKHPSENQLISNEEYEQVELNKQIKILNKQIKTFKYPEKYSKDIEESVKTAMKGYFFSAADKEALLKAVEVDFSYLGVNKKLEANQIDEDVTKEENVSDHDDSY